MHRFMIGVTMNNDSPILYYIHDPMCSWCWAFRAVWGELQQQLAGSIRVKYLLGGLAADSDVTMPLSMQQDIQRHWQVIGQRVKGTQFNFNFWSQCNPRRSTYPACRAVIAARQQGHKYEQAMIFSIQQAYYLQACNPSDNKLLIALAAQLSLDINQFRIDLYAPETQLQLMQEISQSQGLGCAGFPSLILSNQGMHHNINIDYNHMESMLEQVEVVVGA